MCIRDRSTHCATGCATSASPSRPSPSPRNGSNHDHSPPAPAAASLASLGPCRRRTVRRLPGGQRRHRTHQQHLATPHGLADPHALRQLGRARQAPDRPGRPPAHLCRRPGTGAAAPVPPRCAGRSPRPARTGTSRDQILPGVTWCEAWPALRAHLLLIASDGHDPITELATAAAGTELGTATDPAAVLDWRLDPTGTRSHNAGLLPWIPRIPHSRGPTVTYGPGAEFPTGQSRVRRKL